MANTTNYNWETPDDTDLVKDGAAAIRTLGSSVDTTTKALNPSTTLGDIEYRSATANTNTRLPIGTTGQILSVVAGVPSWVANDVGDITEVQAGTGISVASGTGPIPVITNTVATAIDAKGDLIVGTGADTFSRLAAGTNTYILTADSAEATGLKWAAPAGGGDIVKVASASFSGAATITVDNCFTSTYKRYLVSATFGASAAAATRIALRYSGGTETGNYYGSSFQYERNNTLTTFGSNPTSGFIPLTSGTGANVANIYFGKVGTGGSAAAAFYGSGVGTNSQEAFFFAGKADTDRDYTGFIISAASGNFTGSYAVYGLKE
jgi:trimeric autotransporter adhesin